MVSHKQSFSNKRGFTLTEIIVSLGVIAILLGILIPALNVAHDMALNVKQKMQFVGIGLALEAFASDSGYGDYPPSNNNVYDGASDNYDGSFKLAEALVGRDGFGWHPDSEFTSISGLYSSTTISSRKGPYLELEKANAVKFIDIYAAVVDDTDNSFVLTDVYGTVTHKTSGKKVGMPILYYRANMSGMYHTTSSSSGDPEYFDPSAEYNSNHIFDYRDSGFIRNYSHPESGISHPMSMIWFYGATTNPNITSPARPYNHQSYILQSAGPDGLYGTSDDVFNFNLSK